MDSLQIGHGEASLHCVIPLLVHLAGLLPCYRNR